MKNTTFLISALLVAIFSMGKATAQSLSDIDTVWTNIVPMRSHLVSVIPLQNGNYLAHGYNNYCPSSITGSDRAGNWTASSKNEVYLVEFTESGNIIRYKTIECTMPTTDYSDQEARNFISHTRIVERPDGGLLILSEFEHGLGYSHGNSAISSLTNRYRFNRIIMDANWNVMLNDLHGLQFNNYEHEGSTYNWIIGIRLFDIEHTDDGRLLATFSGIKRSTGKRSWMQGLVFLDYSGNIAGTPQEALKVLDIDGVFTVTTLVRGHNNYIIMSSSPNDVWISSGLGCTGFTSLPPIPPCPSCHREGSFAKNMYALPNLGGYVASGIVGIEGSPYNDPSNQHALWYWDNAPAIQSPTPYWFADNKSLSNLVLLNNDAYDDAGEDRFLAKANFFAPGTSSLTDRKLIQFVFSGSEVTYTEGPGLSAPSLNFHVQSQQNDGIMCGGDVTVNGERRMQIGKMSVCSGFTLLGSPNDQSLPKGVACPAYTITPTGEFPGATVNYGYTVRLKSGSLSSHPSAQPGDTLLSGEGVGLSAGDSYTIPGGTYLPSETDPAVLQVEHWACQEWGTPPQQCTANGWFEIDFVRPFTTKWTPGSGSITIPVNTSQTYNYDIYICEKTGTTPLETALSQTAGYTSTEAAVSSADTVMVKIIGKFPHIYFNNTGDKDKIVSVENWGEMEWASMENAFFGCRNLTSVPGKTAAESPQLAGVTSFKNMFRNCGKFDSNLSAWNVSSAMSFKNMFRACGQFNSQLSAWNVGSATDFSGMFMNCGIFNQSLSAWNVSRGTDFSSMFQNATLFNNGDPGNNKAKPFVWTTKDGTQQISGSFRSMFQNARSFNQQVGTWQVDKINVFESMFEDAVLFNDGR